MLTVMFSYLFFLSIFLRRAAVRALYRAGVHFIPLHGAATACAAGCGPVETRWRSLFRCGPWLGGAGFAGGAGLTGLTGLAGLAGLIRLIGLIGLAGLSGCVAAGQRTPAVVPDGAMTQSSRALDLLEAGRPVEACKAFDAALLAGTAYAPAVLGRELCFEDSVQDTGTGALPDGAGGRSGGIPAGCSAAAEQCLRVQTAFFLYGGLDRQRYAALSDGVFDAALQSGVTGAGLLFMRAETLWHTGRLTQARKLYVQAQVARGLDRSRMKLLQRRLADIDRVLRVAVTDTGRRMAFVPELTRARMAGLLEAELAAQGFFEACPAPLMPEFAVPGMHLVPAEEELPADIAGHEDEQAIMAVLEKRLRGLQMSAAGRFDPDSVFRRSDLALLYEDCAIRVSGDPSLAVHFMQSAGVLSDVRRDDAVFNAAVLLVQNGFVQLRDGRFGAEQPVSAMEALQVLAALRGMAGCGGAKQP
jgi:hypothetical protein